MAFDFPPAVSDTLLVQFCAGLVLMRLDVQAGIFQGHMDGLASLQRSTWPDPHSDHVIHNHRVEHPSLILHDEVHDCLR